MNDLFFIDYESKVMLVDMIGVRPDTELAHRRLCDIIWSTGEPPPDDDEALPEMCRVKPHDWARVKGELIAKGWKCSGGRFVHGGAVATLNRCSARHQKRVESGQAGGLASKERRSTATSNATSDATSPATSNATSIAYSNNNHSNNNSSVERERAREEHFPEYPNWEAVRSMAAMTGLAEWKARDWFDEMEGCGWIDHCKRPIVKWENVLMRVKVKWEADGRPMQKQAQKVHTGANTVILGKEYERILARLGKLAANKSDLGYTQPERDELKRLKSRRDELKTILGITV